MAEKETGVPPLLPQRRARDERAEMSRCSGRGDGIVDAAALSMPGIHPETGKIPRSLASTDACLHVAKFGCRLLSRRWGGRGRRIRSHPGGMPGSNTASQ
jgi:hypothetical protein